MTDPIPRYSPQGPPLDAASEPIVYDDPEQCHFCGDVMSPGDLFDYYVRRLKLEDGTLSEADADWFAGGEVVPICQPCLESLRTDVDLREVNPTESLRQRFPWLVFLPLVIGIAAVIILNMARR